MLKILIISLFTLLSACATDLAGLQKTATIQTIEINEARSVTEPQGPFNIKWQKELKAGTYTSIGEDKTGTYFQGPKWCVSLKVDSSAKVYYDGGFWIPKDKKQNPKLFYFFGSDANEELAKSRIDANSYQAADAANQAKLTPAGVAGGAIAGAVVSAMVKAEVGKIEFIKDISDPLFFSNIRNAELIKTK